MKLLKGEILKNEKYGENLYKMEIFSPYICRNTGAGQFISIKCSKEKIFDPILRRPFSIYDIEKEFNVFSILYLVKGRGTYLLSLLKKGDVVDFMGPLGNPITFNKNSNDYLLIGGGIGIAPLYLITKVLTREKKNILFIAGFKNSDFTGVEKDLLKTKVYYNIFTEDGSYGNSGLATDFIKENINKYKKYQFYCCGPVDMLKVLQEIFLGKKISATAIVEQRMACGVGACMGCAIGIKNENGEIVYKRVCKDGPSFNIMEVIFD